MNIYTFGARCLTSQIDRIEQGFKNLGYTINDFSKNPDFIYANDIGSWNKAHTKWLSVADLSFRPKLILNILDLPFHLEYDMKYQIDKIEEFYSYTYVKLTTISHTVKQDIEKYIGIKNIDVIYNPVKDVSHLNFQDRPYKYLIVGRNQDSQKRHHITLKTIQQLDDSGTFKDLWVVGEDIGYGNYLGNLSDKDLNIAYNKAKFVFMPSSFEGLGLPAFEAVICGALPIVLDDCHIADEFWSPNTFSKEDIVDEMKDEFKLARLEGFCNDIRDEIIEKFNKSSIVQNILDLKK